MVKKHREFAVESRFLVVILAILIAVIAGLVVSIVLLNIRKSSEWSGYVLPEELTGDDLTEENQVIKEASIMLQNPEVSMEQIEEYYDGVIKDAFDKGNNYLGKKVIIQKMNFIAVLEGDCPKAVQYADSLDLSQLSENDRDYVNASIESLKAECDDEVTNNKSMDSME